eukprot:TRINITY_DN1621_c0_g1_i1.p1 TRINITY_DN1621_c0_g1~~TRINITY_DN1621_c0_g1_i1.p1  ORF type:complete len:119 (-),score=39.06 TRINITY_DN1621_c0_g1_i1:82-438(-)
MLKEIGKEMGCGDKLHNAILSVGVNLHDHDYVTWEEFCTRFLSLDEVTVLIRKNLRSSLGESQVFSPPLASSAPLSSSASPSPSSSSPLSPFPTNPTTLALGGMAFVALCAFMLAKRA